MSRLVHPFALAAGLIAVVLAIGPAADPPTPAERLKAVRKDVVDAEAAFHAAWAKSPNPDDDPQVEAVFKTFVEVQRKSFDTALELAKADPKSDVAFEALEWMLMTVRNHHQPSGKAAFDMLATYHATSPKIGRGIATLAYFPPREDDVARQKAIGLMKLVAEKNPDKTVRGQAALGLAWLANRAFRDAEAKGGSDLEKLAGAAEKAMEAVVRDYGDCPNLRSQGIRPAPGTLKEEIETDLYELRNLRVGKHAPELEGEDLAGVKFKLSDSRGKVVVVVFWATWCGVCMKAVEHERELVARFKGKPFVLIGVNGDEDKAKATKAVEQAKISWRSFWDGKQGGGPIATAWNVRSWPKVYVIDHTGVIRYKYLHGKRLDEPLEKLVAEAEKAAPSK